VVNPAETDQVIDGFGGAFTDSSAWLYANKLNAAQRQQLIEALFSREQGIGLNWLRQPIGASDFTFNAVPYSFDDLPAGETDPDLLKFSIAHDRAYIIPALQDALKVNPDLKIVAAPWSPPAWMKDNKSMLKGSILPLYFPALARYLVRFIDAYQKEGIPIYALSIQNEPNVTSDYPGMRLLASDAAEFITDYLRPALADAKLAPKLFAFDDNWRDQKYVDALLAKAGTAIDGVAYHCYVGDPAVMSGLQKDFPDKEIHMTECSGHISQAPIPEIMIFSLRNWARSVILWNVLLDEHGGYRQGTGCSPCQGLIALSDNQTLRLTDEYAALGHLSKFMRQGAQRIGSNLFGDAVLRSGRVINVALRNPDGSVVLFAYNGANRPNTFRVRYGDQTFDYTLPARAMVTFTWS
jgi:glucosylceramidase